MLDLFELAAAKVSQGNKFSWTPYGIWRFFLHCASLIEGSR